MVGQLGGRHRGSGGGQQLTGTNVQHMVQAYVTMNRFLSRFLEHVSMDDVLFFGKKIRLTLTCYLHRV